MILSHTPRCSQQRAARTAPQRPPGAKVHFAAHSSVAGESAPPAAPAPLHQQNETLPPGLAHDNPFTPSVHAYQRAGAP